MNPKFSQFDEEEIISNYFGDRKGRFLEIGAADGILASNCHKLALGGWSGVCVEANPFFWGKLFNQYRGIKNIETVCACVGPENGLLNFHLNDDGLATTNEEIFDILNGGTNFYGRCFVPCITPNDLVKAFGNDFDFVSIDAEGMDQRIVELGAKLLENTIMLCVETDRPGHPKNDANYQTEWKRVLGAVGFTRVHHQTPANTILLKG